MPAIKAEKNLTQEEIDLILDEVDEQNRQIKEECKPYYMHYIIEYCRNNYQFLRSMEICLLDYDMKYTRDIMEVFCDVFDIRWKDIGWRWERFQIHQNNIEEVISSDNIEIQCRGLYDETIELGVNELTACNKDCASSEFKYKVTPTFLENCKKELNKLNCTQKCICEMSGLSLQKVKNLCRGKYTKTIKDADLTKIANLFHCSKKYLFGLAPDDRYLLKRISDKKKRNVVFASNFEQYTKVEKKVINYLLAHQECEKFIENLFVVVRVFDNADSQYFIHLIELLAAFLDKPKIYKNGKKTFVEYIFKNSLNGRKPSNWKPQEYLRKSK